MTLKCGIIGLPNTGKSTLFNALTASSAEASNYPFCTIEPNVGMVSIPDGRLSKIANIIHTKKIVPASIEFVDIAGLVRNAHAGEGLGNQFLANILEMDTLAHVVRCFDESDVVHVEGEIDPVRDIEIVETEILLKDMELLERRITRVRKTAKSGDALARKDVAVSESLLDHLNNGRQIRFVELDTAQQAVVDDMKLLSAKPVIYVLNVGEDHFAIPSDYELKAIDFAKKRGSSFVRISTKIEAELIGLTPEDRQMFMKEMELTETALPALIHEVYKTLHIVNFFTANENELHAWHVPQGTKAPQAAGKIHTDFERGFIRAEVISFEDYITFNGEHGAKEHGVMRLEGKEYAVREGDIIFFRFNV
ncbi:MAG: redox-regulated ATPase YchF [Candidatus Auribacterota bacterium]|jgi:GTP-binding protein YchF|nr:redox-regulated ATPase YchF [Candidatus Auribacterota bacterium]